MQLRREVNEKVSAGDDVQVGVGGVTDDILRGEDYGFSQVRANAISSILLYEESLQPGCWRHLPRYSSDIFPGGQYRWPPSPCPWRRSGTESLRFGPDFPDTPGARWPWSRPPLPLSSPQPRCVASCPPGGTKSVRAEPFPDSASQAPGSRKKRVTPMSSSLERISISDGFSCR